MTVCQPGSWLEKQNVLSSSSWPLFYVIGDIVMMMMTVVMTMMTPTMVMVKVMLTRVFY